MRKLLSPDHKDFDISDLDLAFELIEWREDPVKFFEDVTGLKARDYQKEYLRSLLDFDKKYMVIVSARDMGKTLCLAVTALWYAIVLSFTSPGVPMEVVVLAGSRDQAKICYAYILQIIGKIPFLQEFLAKEPTQTEIVFKNGSIIKPLAASQKAVRGHHPNLLIVDEAREVEEDLFDAALTCNINTPYFRQIYVSTPPDESLHWFNWRLGRHKERLEQLGWKFFHWSSLSVRPKEILESLKEHMPEDVFRREVLGEFYYPQGKMFSINHLKQCLVETTSQDPNSPEVYAGLDWGFRGDPTALVVVQRVDDKWRVLEAIEWKAEHMSRVHDEIERICRDRKVIAIFADSTAVGENMRLIDRGLPVQEISFKKEKQYMLANLRMLVERGKLELSEKEHQFLIGELVDYSWDQKGHDDLVDALMLATRQHHSYSRRYSLREYFERGVVTKRKSSSTSSPLTVSRSRARWP